MEYWPFDKICISNIYKFQLYYHEKGYIINYVISSTWKSMVPNIKELNDLFNLKGLYLTNIIGKTERLNLSDSPRGKEILQWLKNNNKENSIYVAIDDEIDYDIKQYIDEKHYLKTMFKTGFDDESLKKIINKINKIL